MYEPSATEKVKAFGKRHWKKIAGVAGGLAIGATVLLLKKDSDDGFDGEIIEGHFEELANTVSNTVQNVADTVVETVEEIGSNPAFFSVRIFFMPYYERRYDQYGSDEKLFKLFYRIVLVISMGVSVVYVIDKLFGLFRRD